ncbi:hypothetical protein [Alkalicoccus luteus]|uniref:hypothetical protein n=1 Tax=Alkalicoccus luteus TaxID=1237094 RepID=UPI0040344C70
MEIIMLFPFVAFAVFIGMFLGSGPGKRNWLAGCALMVMVVLTLLFSFVMMLGG